MFCRNELTNNFPLPWFPTHIVSFPSEFSWPGWCWCHPSARLSHLLSALGEKSFLFTCLQEVEGESGALQAAQFSSNRWLKDTDPAGAVCGRWQSCCHCWLWRKFKWFFRIRDATQQSEVISEGAKAWLILSRICDNFLFHFKDERLCGINGWCH